MNKSWGG
ncbi:hypothetical protein YPPY34_3097, partial [Yersinia pestis PY-34]